MRRDQVLRVVVLSALAGCTAAQLPADTVEQRVGPSGGQVLNSSGSGVAIPSGALSTTVAIRVGPAPASQPLPPAVLVGDMMQFGPEGQTFSKPVAVVLEVDVLRLPPGRGLTDVVVWTTPLGGSQWEVLPTRVIDAAHVEATAFHFSVFAPVVSGTGNTGEDGGAAGGQGGGFGGGAGGGAGGGTGTCVGGCGSGGAGDGGADCECSQTCGGETLEIICSGTGTLGCACVRNGQQVGVVTLPFCPSARDLVEACGFGPDAGIDGGTYDGGAYDGGAYDGGAYDGGAYDGGAYDGGAYDGGAYDGGVPDGGAYDGGVSDAGVDGGAYDAGTPDAGANDGG